MDIEVQEKRPIPVPSLPLRDSKPTEGSLLRGMCRLLVDSELLERLELPKNCGTGKEIFPESAELQWSRRTRVNPARA